MGRTGEEVARRERRKVISPDVRDDAEWERMVWDGRVGGPAKAGIGVEGGWMVMVAWPKLRVNIEGGQGMSLIRGEGMDPIFIGGDRDSGLLLSSSEDG